MTTKAKLLLLGGAAVALPPLFWVLGGYWAFKAIRRAVAGNSSNVSAPVASPGKEEKARGDKKEQARSVSYSRRHGWDLSALPVSMTANLSDGRSKFFTVDCAGIPDAVQVEAARGGVRFTYDAGRLDPETALRVEKLVESARNTDLSFDAVNRSGRAVFTGSDLRVAEALVRAVNPVEKVSWKGSLSSVSEVLVSGCASREDAERVAAVSPDRCVELNRYKVRSVEGPGGKAEQMIGSPLTAEDLPGGKLEAGSYLVRLTRDAVASGERYLPKELKEDTGRLLEYVGGDIDALGLSVEAAKPSVTEATPEGVRREMRLSDGTTVALRDPSEPLPGDLHAYAFFDTYEEAFCFMNDSTKKNALPEGMGFVLSCGENKPSSNGRTVLDIPLDKESFKNLMQQDAFLSDDDITAAGKLGVSADALRYSILLHCLEHSPEGVPYFVNANDWLPDAAIDGVDCYDLKDRLVSRRLVSLISEDADGNRKLDAEGLKKWAAESSRIQSITLTVNPATGKLTIISVVDGVQADPVVIDLTPSQINSFSLKGLTLAEKKDLLMRLDLDRFSIYKTDKGNSIFVSPSNDFVKGIPPTLRDQTPSKKNVSNTKKKTASKTKKL